MSTPFELAAHSLLATMPPGTGFGISVWSGRSGQAETLLTAAFGEAQPGQPWETDTLVPVWSTGKGPASWTVLLALEQAQCTPETPLANVWPGWPHGGTVAQLLSHQVGLAALDVPQKAEHHDAVVAQLLRQPLNWPLGQGQGYHPRTIGYLWDELVRKLTGQTLATFWRTHFAIPHSLDIWFGLPEAFLQTNRLAKVRPGPLRPRQEEVAFRKAFGQPQSLTARAFQSLRGWHSVGDFNSPPPLLAGPPAFGAVASADGLAKFYALLTTPTVPPWCRQAAETTLCQDQDLVLLDFTAYTSGFQQDPVHPLTGQKLRRHYGPSLRAFGHPGAGGSLAFADPERQLGVGFVLNGLEPGVFPNPQIIATVEAAVASCQQAGSLPPTTPNW